VEESSIGVDLDMSYFSKFMWRGYDVFDDHAVFQPSAGFDLFDTGFSVKVMESIPAGSGSNHHGDGINEMTRLDCAIAYGLSLFEEEAYAMDLSTNFIYYNFPKLNHTADIQELGAGVSMPNLLAIGDIALVPAYYAGQVWPNSSGSGMVAGGVHILSLSSAVEVPCPVHPEESQAFNLSVATVYNDGLLSSDTDHDWSHVVFGVSTSLEIEPVTVTPAINYQVSMDDSVNDEDELWGGVSVAYSF